MKKQIIIATMGMFFIAATTFAQTEIITVAALDVGQMGHRDQVIKLTPAQPSAPSISEQMSQLISIGDRFMAEGQYMPAVQVFWQSDRLAKDNGIVDDNKTVEWKLGLAYWKLAKQENIEGYALIAQVLMASAGSVPMDDPRCNKLSATGSACNN